MNNITASDHHLPQPADKLPSREYSRSLEHVRLVRELSALPIKRMMTLCCDPSVTVTNRVPEEVLVALSRRLAGSGESAHAWTLAMELARRCRGKVTHTLRLWRIDRPEANPAETMDEVLTTLYEAVLDPSAKSEFWEVRFWVAFDRRLVNIVRRRRGEIERLSDRDDADEDVHPSPLEGAINSHSVIGSFDDPFIHAAVAEALSVLPEKIRAAYILKHAAKLPEESVVGDTQTIAEVLGVSGRTVRNYLAKADNLLAAWRSGEPQKKAQGSNDG